MPPDLQTGASARPVPLSELAEIISGQSPPGETYRRTPEGLPFFQGKADFGPRSPTPRVWCVAPERIAEPGDILVSVRAPVGPTNVAVQRCCIGRGLAAIRCRAGLDRDYLLWYLRFLEPTLSKHGAGSTFGAISRAELERLHVPVLEFSQQRRIAAELTAAMAAVDRARAAAQERLAAAEAMSTAYLREAFEGEGPARWERVRLGDHVTKIGSGITPRGGKSAYVASGVPLIRSQNVHLLRFEPAGLAFITARQDAEMRLSRVQEGDVLLNITGASIGRCCVVPSEYCPANVNQHVSIIRTVRDRLDPEFLSAYLASPRFQRYIIDSQAGATRQALTKEMIKEFLVPAPPIAEQRRLLERLAVRLRVAARLRIQVESEVAALDALPTSFLRRAFSGGDF